MPHAAVTRHLQAAVASGVLLCLLDLERLEPAQSSTLSARIKQVVKVRRPPLHTLHGPGQQLDAATWPRRRQGFPIP